MTVEFSEAIEDITIVNSTSHNELIEITLIDSEESIKE